ncbi:TIGR03546 family protein [Acetonema longum]|uniref:DUF2062 domain-containing protein n=1 Tax=Acetonema longum DSM 6540 TaxID=1009370 RepID=F7NHB7_9FIRM|nr:TIGR03546 family protein [Acetonema longum]EGO64600.1 hypothetical protein ALO_07313 [Acetonema longum DSM 6540]
MVWLADLIFRTFKILHSGNEPKHMAGGFALGSIIGLTPALSLQTLLVYCLILLVNVNIGAAFFSIFVFSCFAYLLDPLFHAIGYFLLVKVEFLTPVWTYLYNIPIAPLTRFYNTVVLGSLVVSLVLFCPVYLVFTKFVVYYQKHWAQRVEKLKIVQWVRANTLFQWYEKVTFKSMGE